MMISVISFTEKGRKLSLKIAGLPCPHTVRRYCFCKHSDNCSESFVKFHDISERLFYGSDALIFVCACGIAVREISPYVKSKLTDPAVIVTDDGGNFVIPVLSGHIGGANALARFIADHLGAQAVITTATDIGGKFSPDSFAAANDLILTDITAAKLIASAVLDGESIGLISLFEVKNLPPEIVRSKDTRYGICIGKNAADKPFPLTLNLMPKNVVIGIGCKKRTSAETIRDAVNAAMTASGIPFERICAAASVDLKTDEAGLLEFCEKSGFPFTVYSAGQLGELKGNFSSSEFVSSVAGVDNVCERSAVKCSGGDLIMRKYIRNGVTVAAAEKPLIIDFEREII